MGAKGNVVPPPDTHPFPFTWVSDAVLSLDTRPIVNGLFDPGAFVLIYGPSGSGKSFFTADLGQHIACGTAWRSRRVQRSLVVYVASEAGASILKRFIAWREHRLVDKTLVPLAILTRGPNLLASVEVEKLCEQLAALQQQAGLPLGLAVFDTLSRSIPGGDENKAEDMTMAVAAADIIRDRFSAATAYVHHSGKDHARGSRGHSSVFAAADLVIGIDNHVATVEKVRDGVAGETFPFRLDRIELGMDPFGEPVNTCLLSAADAGEPARRKDPTGKHQRMMYMAVRELVAAEGEPMPGTSVIPKGVKAVNYSKLVERLLPKMPDMKPFTARQRLSTAAISLQEAGYVGVHGDRIWLL